MSAHFGWVLPRNGAVQKKTFGERIFVESRSLFFLFVTSSPLRHSMIQCARDSGQISNVLFYPKTEIHLEEATFVSKANSNIKRCKRKKFMSTLKRSVFFCVFFFRGCVNDVQKQYRYRLNSKHVVFTVDSSPIFACLPNAVD